MYLCVDMCTLSLCPQRPKVSESTEMELQTVVSSLMWVFEPHSDPLEEQWVRLTTEPPLKPLILVKSIRQKLHPDPEAQCGQHPRGSRLPFVMAIPSIIEVFLSIIS